MMDEAGLQQIEENAEIILSEIGIQFNEYPSALTLLEEAGCRIDGEMVYFPKGCLLYTSPSPRDKRQSRMPSSA